MKTSKLRGIENNPIDVLAYLGVELISASCNITEALGTDFLENMSQRIKEQKEILCSMSEQDMKICKKTSAYCNLINTDKVNSVLSKIRGIMPLDYFHNTSLPNIEFVKYFNTEDSELYQRMSRLNPLLDNRFKNTGSDYFADMLDASIYDNEYCLWVIKMKQSEIDELLNVKEELGLSVDDIIYMLSYCQYRENMDSARRAGIAK